MFVTCEARMGHRLNELQSWLLKCKYPIEIIQKAFHNARLQGPAPMKSNQEEIITFIHPNMSNYSFNNIINTAKTNLYNNRSDEVTNVFSNMRIIEGIKQPKNLLRLLTNTTFTDTPNIPRTLAPLNPGIYAECKDKRCNLCNKGYIQECSSFVTDNDVTWTIKSHINCNSKNVLYFLICNMCKKEGKPESNTGKTETRLRDRMNNHISDCRTGNTTDKFDLHVHQCGILNNCLKPPYFQIYAFMTLRSPEKLLIYENWLHKKHFDSMNRK